MLDERDPFKSEFHLRYNTKWPEGVLVRPLYVNIILLVFIFTSKLWNKYSRLTRDIQNISSPYKEHNVLKIPDLLTTNFKSSFHFVTQRF